MKPTFVIIGEQKCGTGWLRDRLREHPRVYCHPGEVNFFNHRGNHARGFESYSRLLEGRPDALAIGEKSPDYFWLNRFSVDHFPNPLQNIAQDLPQARVVLSLRNPVDRAISAFRHHLEHRGRRIHPRLTRDIPFEDLLFDDRYGIAERWGILGRGFYSERLRIAQELFGERLLTLIFEEDVVAQPEQGLTRVCEHLGIRAADGRFRLRDNPKERRPAYRELIAGHYVPALRPLLRRLPLGPPYHIEVEPGTRRRLEALYAEDVVATLRLLGRNEWAWPSWDRVAEAI